MNIKNILKKIFSEEIEENKKTNIPLSDNITEETLSDTFRINNSFPLQIKSSNLYAVNILTIADTHGYRKNIIDKLKNIPESSYDVVFTLGDIPLDMLRDIKLFSKKEVYGILGNHDTEDVLLKANIDCLEDAVVTVKDLSFTGINGSFKYKPSCIGYTHEESMEFFKNKPKVDILISHDTVQNLYANVYGASDAAHQGLSGITYYMQYPEVKINIHGHYHRNLQWLLNDKCILSCYGLNLICIDGEKIYKHILYDGL